MLSVVPQLARRGAAAKMPGFIKGNCLEEGVGEPPQNTLAILRALNSSFVGCVRVTAVMSSAVQISVSCTV